jgi:hypothetical protein
MTSMLRYPPPRRCLSSPTTRDAKSAEKVFQKVVAGVEKEGARRGSPTRKIRSNQKFGREELFNTADNKNRERQRC